jgi:hypothetical protein
LALRCDLLGHDLEPDERIRAEVHRDRHVAGVAMDSSMSKPIRMSICKLPAALNECRVSTLPKERPGRACAIGDAGCRKAARRPPLE